MQGIDKLPLQFKYTQDDGLAVVDSAQPGIPFKIAVLQFVSLPPHAIGGNHKHPRTEVFLALGVGLELHWQDDEQQMHVEPLKNNEMVLVRPHTPHFVINSSNSLVSVAEWADAIQYDVEKLDLH